MPWPAVSLDVVTETSLLIRLLRGVKGTAGRSAVTDRCRPCRAAVKQALAIAYYDSAAFKAWAGRTQGVYRNIIDRFCRDHGDRSAVTIKSHNIENLMAARAAKRATPTVCARCCAR